MSVEAAVGEVALTAAAVMAAVGVYGLTASQNLVRQLLSIEVLFNAVLIMVILLFSFNPVSATVFAITLIAVVSGEVIVVVAIIASLYRRTRSLESLVLEEEGV